MVKVSVGTVNYPIYIGSGILSDTACYQRHVSSKNTLIVTDELVAPHYLSKVEAVCQNFTNVHSVVLQTGEQYKTHQNLFSIYDALFKARLDRQSLIIALGGGVIGDLTGFAAATYHRGLPFIQIPTTVVSQVDSSVGGKVGVNYANTKNTIGTFYHPICVISDIDTLSTLPQREKIAGGAEIIKYALLAGGELLQKLEASLQHSSISLYQNKQQFADIATMCCRYKADLIQQDEKDTGKRQLLNLGHTFAHAIEAYTDMKQYLHGEAVGIGLYCMALLSCRLGYLSSQNLQRVQSLLERADLSHKLAKQTDIKATIELMKQDKKNHNNKIRLILMREFGDCFIDDCVDEKDIYHVLKLVVAK